MIIAIGTDVVEVERVRRALDHARTGERFRARVYTAGEIAYCAPRRGGAESFAVRFAAKEAVMKVLGGGFGDGIGWRDIEIVRTDGAPTILVHGRARDRAAAMGITRWHVSLSHTAAQAVAVVVAEGDG